MCPATRGRLKTRKLAAPGGLRCTNEEAAPVWSGLCRVEVTRAGSNRLQVACRLLARAAVRLHLIGDLLTFRQTAQAGTLQRGGMDEHVLAATVRLNEAIALCFVVPLHSPSRHRRSSSSRQVRLRPIIVPRPAERSSARLTVELWNESSSFHPSAGCPRLREEVFWSRSEHQQGTTCPMTMLRQFLMAPSLARLIQLERGGERVVEGYFPDQPHHSIYVQVEEDRSSLILAPHSVEGSPEERTGVPTSQAQALLAVAS